MPDVDLEDMANESLELSMSFIALIKRKMKMDDEDQDKLTTQQLQSLSGLLTKVQRAAATMLKEMRAINKDGKIAAEKLGYDEKRTLVLEWITMMPAEHQSQLRRDLGWQ